MNYIEELKSGDTFVFENSLYVLGIDFKKSGDRLAISLTNGVPKWFDTSSIVVKTPIYTLDATNNIIPVIENKNELSI